MCYLYIVNNIYKLKYEKSGIQYFDLFDMMLIMFNCVLYETLLGTYMNTCDFQDFI